MILLMSKLVYEEIVGHKYSVIMRARMLIQNTETNDICSCYSVKHVRQNVCCSFHLPHISACCLYFWILPFLKNLAHLGHFRLGSNGACECVSSNPLISVTVSAWMAIGKCD